MKATVFESHPLPAATARQLRRRLEHAHRDAPFSPLDPRQNARRVATLVADLGLDAKVYRGALDLHGVEVDHLWLSVRAPDDPPRAWVVDVAFPLFVEEFVAALRLFVAGDAEPEALAASAAHAGVGERILGVFPSPFRYRGAPVWSARHA